MTMQTDLDHLLSLQAVRERANRVYDLAKGGKLNYFRYNEEQLPHVASFVADVISRDFGPDRYHEIPPHGRWQHFNIGGVDRVAALLDNYKGDEKDQARRLVDLFVVSVLLDAGTGGRWYFKEPNTQESYGRSEGIAVATLYMFRDGAFSSNGAAEVDGHALQNLTAEAFASFFQVGPQNPLVGIDARVQLLREVGKSLLNLSDIFGEHGRPGRLVDHLVASTTSTGTLDYAQLWNVLQRLLLPAWPKTRPQLDGQPIGDAWPLEVLKNNVSGSDRGKISATIQPFHKLTQWLGYSLTTPFTRVLGLEWRNMDLGTGLPEYRNGGLFVDLGALTLNDRTLALGREASGEQLPMFKDTSDVIIEWRAMTVALLDRLHELIKAHFEKQGVQINMAQMLEAGTWKSGRELAKKYRPDTNSSPILIDGDGTLF